MRPHIGGQLEDFLSGHVVAAFRTSLAVTTTGPMPLPATPCYFAPEQSVPAPVGFSGVVVADGGLADADVIGLPDAARDAAGTLLVPGSAAGWLHLDGAANGALVAELRAAFRRYVAVAGASWRVGGRPVSLVRPLVMGVINVTPDSFSDGGRTMTTAQAVSHGMALAQAGADILDVGGESTRPGSHGVVEEEELGRVLPVVAELANRVDVPISIDTRKAVVARAALAAGAQIVNDVSALHDDPAMAAVVREHDAGLILMHMRGQPSSMQQDTRYRDLFGEIVTHLEASLALAYDEGIDLRGVLVDPGIGFGKGLEENLELVGRLGRLWALGRPLLLGASRKRFLGELTGREVGERVFATVSAVTAGVLSGASVVRVHDVAAALDAVRVAAALRGRMSDGV